MGDYNLEGLNPRDFQHLIQAIARKQIAPGITSYGDGKDGNRDLSYKGTMTYPSTEEKWGGYLVVGCKFNLKPTGDTGKDKAWAAKQLEADLKKFLTKRRKLTKPEYYIFVTNLRLSPVPKSGGRAKVEEVLQNYSSRLNLKGFGIWDYNDIRGFLDGDADLRAAYGHFITAGDVLAAMMSRLNIDRPDFIDVMHTFLQKELIADMSAKLQSAGEDPEVQIPLANVFVDLPFAVSAEAAVLVNEEEEDKLEKVVATLLQAGASVLRRMGQAGTTIDRRRHAPVSRFVIVGGPGQGKSTFGQYLCQLYRAAILADRPAELLDERVPSILKVLQKQTKDSGGLPLTRRFPLRIELRNFAHALASDPQLTLIEYIRRDMARLGNSTINMADLKTWLEKYPWVLILDGLDEVPPSSNRSDVLKEIDSFRVDAASRNSDMLLIATTRPQSYSKEFSEELFQHLYLTPLSPRQALNYGHKLAEARCGGDERRRDELVRSLEKACKNPATSRLMQSPLQVTIMATLLEDTGEPPQQKYRLFAEYYRTIYKRETRRKLLGGILTERQKDIDTIHAHAGLLLQAATEEAKPRTSNREDVDSALSDEQFRILVRRRLERIGISMNRVSELLDQISDGSLQRLVFLVRPKVGWVRFDIASLKEFMAAEAIMNGSDEDIRERLKVVAPASYWRNVFQFAVGKCFVEREHLLDNLVSLCAGLNEAKACEEIMQSEVAGRAAKQVLWGSRLALDILADGTARQYPGYELRFARIALQLVKLPEAEICARLASVFHEDLKDLYLEVLNDRLGQTNLWSRLGAFYLLSSLAELDEHWAIRLLDANWPDDSEFVKSVLLSRKEMTMSRWTLGKLSEVVPRLDPIPLRHELRTRFWRSKSSHSTDRWEDMMSLVSPPAYQRQEITNRSSWASLVSTFFITGSHQRSEVWENVRNTEFEHPNWFPFVSSARFASNPSAHALAAELRWLADAGMPARESWRFVAPWPLAVCLRNARSVEDLLALANAAEKGILGDIKVWSAVEKRWVEQGLSDEDFNMTQKSRFPLSADGSAIGFPFGSSTWRASDNFSSNQMHELAENIHRIENSDAKSQLASFILNVSLDRGIQGFGPNQFRELYELADESRLSFPIDAALQSITGPVTNDWVDLFDRLGRSSFWISSRDCCEIGERLSYHLSTNPNARKGLLRIIAALAVNGCRYQIPKGVLQEALSWDPKYKMDALCLSLSRNDLTEVEMKLFAKELYHNENMGWTTWRALRIMSDSSLSRAAEFAVEILDLLKDDSEKAIETGEHARRILNEYLTNKPSLIQKVDVWNRLNLPERL